MKFEIGLTNQIKVSFYYTYSMRKQNLKKANKTVEIDASFHASETQSRWRMQSVALAIYTKVITPHNGVELNLKFRESKQTY